MKPDHPVNILDVPKETKIKEGTVQMLPPVPLLSGARLEGEYYQGKINGNTIRIAKPNFSKYSNVSLPQTEDWKRYS